MIVGFVFYYKMKRDTETVMVIC